MLRRKPLHAKAANITTMDIRRLKELKFFSMFPAHLGIDELRHQFKSFGIVQSRAQEKEILRQVIELSLFYGRDTLPRRAFRYRLFHVFLDLIHLAHACDEDDVRILLDERLHAVGCRIRILLHGRHAARHILPAEHLGDGSGDTAVELHAQSLRRTVQDSDTLLILRHTRKNALDFFIHFLDERFALLLFARNLRENLDLALHILIALHVDDEGRNLVCLQRRDKLFVHALVDDDEIRLAGKHLFHIDLVDFANACLVLREVRHLRLGVGAADDIPAHGMKRFEEGCRQHDDALGLL